MVEENNGNNGKRVNNSTIFKSIAKLNERLAKIETKQEDRHEQRLNHRDHDGSVACVLGDHLAPEFAFLGELLEVRHDHGKQLPPEPRRGRCGTQRRPCGHQ